MGLITLDHFEEIILSWGFEAKQQHVKELFDWLDYDKD